MDIDDAVDAMGALAHRNRMQVFRLLVREGPSGLAAGEIAARLRIAPSALSFHLSQLQHAGLVRSWRAGRNSMYAIAVNGMRELLTFLTKDCCGGRPELCGGVGSEPTGHSTEEALADEPG